VFAGLVAPVIYEYVTQNTRGLSIVQLLEMMRTRVVDNVLSMKAGALKQQGCYGYIAAMLTAGYTLLTKSPQHRQVLATFSTDNWAYVLNERSLRLQEAQTASGHTLATERQKGRQQRLLLAQSPTVTQLDSQEQQYHRQSTDWGFESEDGSLECVARNEAKREKIQEIARKPRDYLRDTSDKFVKLVAEDYKRYPYVRLFRREGLPGGNDDLIFKLENGDWVFTCATYFPDVTDDFLLFLTLAGCPTSPGLRLKPSREQRISASRLIASVWAEIDSNKFPNVNALMPDWGTMEFRAVASFMTACNAGELTGCSVDNFLALFASELINSSLEPYVNILPPHLSQSAVDPSITENPGYGWDMPFKVKFILPPETTAPYNVLGALPIHLSSRPSNSGQCDFEVFDRDGRNHLIMEVKSSLKEKTDREVIVNTLQRQDAHAVVSFLVVEKSVENVLTNIQNNPFILSAFQTINRMDNTSGPSLSDARFLNVQIEHVQTSSDSEMARRIALRPLDGKELGPGSLAGVKRLIFLISLADIHEQIRR
jgi:hypothetical protein